VARGARRGGSARARDEQRPSDAAQERARTAGGTRLEAGPERRLGRLAAHGGPGRAAPREEAR
jgi:hypothetical protein